MAGAGHVFSDFLTNFKLYRLNLIITLFYLNKLVDWSSAPSARLNVNFYLYRENRGVKTLISFFIYP